MTQIVILSGGYAGVATALGLNGAAPQPRSNRRYRRRAPTGPPTLASVREAMMNAAMAMQAADVAPTMRQIAACDAARAQFEELMPRWNALKSSSSMR